jgi:hypothetical protein
MDPLTLFLAVPFLPPVPHRALQVSPTHPAALLGCAEALLASAHAHTRSGAPGVAAVELSAAGEHIYVLACAHLWLSRSLPGISQILLTAIICSQR